MLLAISYLYVFPVKLQRRIVFSIAFIEEANFYSLITWIRVERYFPLENPFTYFSDVRFELRVWSILSIKDVSSAKIFKLMLIRLVDLFSGTFFVLYTFRVALFSCCTFFHSAYGFTHFVALYLCFTLFKLHFFVLYNFRVALFPCCSFFILHFFRIGFFFVLHSFRIALFSCCTRFYVVPFVHSFHVAPFPCYNIFMLNSFQGALFPCSKLFGLHLFRVTIFFYYTLFTLHLSVCCTLFM